MEIGIIGLPQSGKTTIFSCLTRGRGEASGGHGERVSIGVAKVPDPRLEGMAKIFKPQKAVMAEVRYMDVPLTPRGLGKSEAFGGRLLDSLIKVDALLLVVRAFQDPSVSHVAGSIDPYRDIDTMNLELAYSDLAILERRRARLEDSLKGARGQERDRLWKEQALIERVREGLEGEVPTRDQRLDSEERKVLNNYQFLTGKPMLVVLNIGEEEIPRIGEMESEMEARLKGQGVRGGVVCGKLEEELSQLSEAEARDFRQAMGGGEAAAGRILRLSFQLLGLVSFLTFGPKEVRAWPVARETEAAKAAGVVHSDMERGFIRAEVIGYEELERCGSIAEARRRGLLRLEGRSYKVQDGDVITFLFNV